MKTKFKGYMGTKKSLRWFIELKLNSLNSNFKDLNQVIQNSKGLIEQLNHYFEDNRKLGEINFVHLDLVEEDIKKISKQLEEVELLVDEMSQMDGRVVSQEVIDFMKVGGTQHKSEENS